MHKKLLDLPTRIETERLFLRCFEPGDGPWYYAVGRKNRSHLSRYEPDNVVMSIETEEDAKVLVRELAGEWMARSQFFLAAFEKTSGKFVAQIYIGPVNWDLPEFQIGYFVDVDHEGRGFVTEAVRAAVRFSFVHLKAHRVRIECDDTNVRSYRVADRCGFVREGHFRENKKNPDGTISGTLYFGLLKREFEVQNTLPNSPGDPL